MISFLVDPNGTISGNVNTPYVRLDREMMLLLANSDGQRYSADFNDESRAFPHVRKSSSKVSHERAPRDAIVSDGPQTHPRKV